MKYKSPAQFLMEHMGAEAFVQTKELHNWTDEDICREAARLRSEMAARDVNPYEKRITTDQLDKNWLERK